MDKYLQYWEKWIVFVTARNAGDKTLFSPLVLCLQELLKYSRGCDGCGDLQEALSSILGILKAVNDSMHLIAITGYEVRGITCTFILKKNYQIKALFTSQTLNPLLSGEPVRAGSSADARLLQRVDGA